MTVFDVGANAGALSVLMSRLVGLRGIVCSFEASRRIVDKTQHNLVANAATRIVTVTPDAAAAIDAAYLAVLTRRPTAEEREVFVPRLAAARGNDRRRVLEDLYWVLVNSTEFSWNH